MWNNTLKMFKNNLQLANRSLFQFLFKNNIDNIAFIKLFNYVRTRDLAS